MFFVAQIVELDKSSLGDVAIYKIKNLSYSELVDIIRKKNRMQFPLQWDLDALGCLDLQELRPCFEGDTYINVKTKSLPC